MKDTTSTVEAVLLCVIYAFIFTFIFHLPIVIKTLS